MGLQVSSVQFQHRANDKAYNLSRIDNFTREAAARGSCLVVFPEMCISGYWHIPKLDAAGLERIAELLSGPSVSLVVAMAREQGIAIGAGLLEKGQDGSLYNSYVVCMPDGKFHCHRKLHAFEHKLISSGSSYTVFDTPWGIRAGILICWDNNLVENARATASCWEQNC